MYGTKYEKELLTAENEKSELFRSQKKVSWYSTALSMMAAQKLVLEDIHCHSIGLLYNHHTEEITYDSTKLQIFAVACPVDVTVYNKEGRLIASLSNDEFYVQSGYEKYFFTCELNDDSGDCIKIAIVPDYYEVVLQGMGTGTMNVYIANYTNGIIEETAGVYDIPVTEDTTGYFVASDENTELEDLVVDDAVYVGNVTEPISNPFKDVPEGSFYYEPVLWAVENGITTGTTATTFSPETACECGQVVTFLWRAAGSPEPESTRNPFEDVKTSDFFYEPVLWAVENGITNGIDATHFGPATYCNRAQVVTFLYRAAKINNDEPAVPTEPQPTVPGGDDNGEIVKVASGIDFYAVLKSNGKVEVVSWNDLLGSDECADWTDIVDIDANNYFILGLRKNGSVVFEGVKVGSRGDVGEWNDIKQVSAGGFFSAGLKTNGTVVAVGSNGDGQCNVSDWTGIIAISTGFSHTVGLKADGTVVATGSNHMVQCDVTQWSDIIAIVAGDGITIGLKADGTVVSTCVDWYYNTPAWTDIRGRKMDRCHCD